MNKILQEIKWKNQYIIRIKTILQGSLLKKRYKDKKKIIS